MFSSFSFVSWKNRQKLITVFSPCEKIICVRAKVFNLSFSIFFTRNRENLRDRSLLNADLTHLNKSQGIHR